ncbi:helix-turn-helix domain-containing protein [Brachybacterium sp. AOP43-C2-M15]|uniref:helix-turn-helix domain-containing protein n=1 Tax=Brachybacterium sp. AOP43-C2-M15 TaxID=3457661 RepID=UPI0040333121
MNVKWLTAGDLSERWGIPAPTLAGWRYQGKGPRYMKLGGAVRYRLEDVEAFENENLIGADR